MTSKPMVALERITTLIRVWGTLRPGSMFYGMTLEQCKVALQPSFDIRAELDAIDEQRYAATVRRDACDVMSMEVVRNIVNAIKADPREGENGELYAGLGYVRRDLRGGGRPRLRQSTGVPSADATPVGAEVNATKIA